MMTSRGRGGTAASQERKALAMLLLLEIILNHNSVYYNWIGGNGTEIFA